MSERSVLSLVPLLVLSLLCVGVGCRSRAERQEALFQFAGEDLSPVDVLETDPPLQGKAASYSVPARRWLSYAPPSLFEAEHVSGYDGWVGPYEYTAERYTEAGPAPLSPYFVVPSDEEPVADGLEILDFGVAPAQAEVSPNGGTVWARAWIRAPAFVPLRSADLSLAIVVDLSPSMRRGESLTLAREAVRSAISALLPSDRVAIIAFANDAQVLVEGADPGSPGIARALDTLPNFGRGQAGGDLGAGLLAAYDVLERSRDAIGVPGHVILISDGHFESTWRAEDLAHRYHSLGVRLSTVGVGDEIEPRSLLALARAGEGSFAAGEDASHLRSELELALRRLAKAYARNVRLKIVSERARVAGVYGVGLPGSAPLQELVLPDLVPGEERNVLVRLTVPPLASSEHEEVRFRLSFQQEHPVRRTTLERSVLIEKGTAPRTADAMIEAHARVASGFDWLAKAVETGDEFETKRLLDLEDGLPRLRAVARAQGDRDLEDRVNQLALLASRLRDLRSRNVPRTDPAWRELSLAIYRAAD